MLVEDSAPTATATDTDALIEEARRRTRRRRRRGAAAVAILAAGAILGAIAAGGGPGAPSSAAAGDGAGALSASPATRGSGASASLTLPLNTSFWTVQRYGRELLLTGEATIGNGCTWLVVAPATLRTRRTLRANCDRPPIAAEPIVPIQIPIPDSNSSRLRIARVGAAPGAIRLGPVVMSYLDVSNTKLEWTYGPGTLWLYDIATSRGAEVLEVSTATGAVVDRLLLPKLRQFDKPDLAADADGLWIAASPQTDPNGPAPLYLIAPGARSARSWEIPAHAAVWLVADGHTVWADIETFARHDTLRLRIWRFDGAAASAHPLAAANDLSGYAPALQPGGAALWTVNSLPTNGNYTTCRAQQLVRIDAASGRQTVAATLRQLPDEPCLQYGLSQTFSAGAFYLIGSDYSPETLYRVPVTSTAATAAGP